MQSIQVANLKADFSSILSKVQNHKERFIIEYGKKRDKIAMLVPYEQEKKSRVFGQLKGRIKIDDNFDDEIEEINNMFYGQN
jgi:antitoxin (DNA-binding transcriptional repressor) of toxin-antitoxin stability system